jgi:hypothetical protein
MVNLPMTSVAELRSHRIAIAACFAFRREISSSALWDFFDSIDPKQPFIAVDGRQRPNTLARGFSGNLGPQPKAEHRGHIDG